MILGVGDTAPTIKDSGARRRFSTGAVRDIAEGKGRCDLLPLEFIVEFTGHTEFHYIEDYIRTGDETRLVIAIDYFRAQLENRVEHSVSKERLMLDVAKHYEAGALKYAERNWELGMPVHNYINSGVRHLLKYYDGQTDEPHDQAFVWNMLGAIWTHRHFPELRDLPFAREDTRDEPVRRVNK